LSLAINRSSNRSWTAAISRADFEVFIHAKQRHNEMGISHFDIRSPHRVLLLQVEFRPNARFTQDAPLTELPDRTFE